MENKELYRKVYEKGELINDVIINEKEVNIKLNTGDLILSDFHSQDCCESVYADMETFKLYIDELKGKVITEYTIKGVEDMGFLFSVKYDWNSWVKIFIPCYNSLNGYYSSELELQITENGVKTVIDITKYVEDDIG